MDFTQGHLKKSVVLTRACSVAGGACQIRLSRSATTDRQPRHTQRVQLRVMPRPTFVTYFVCGVVVVVVCVSHTVCVCGVWV